MFGPADFMASIGMPSLTVGQADAGYAGDAFYYPLMRILVAARANGLQAIDGPYVKVRDVEGFRRAAASVAALGFDGKWVLHPDQITAANETFTPRQADYDRAELILDAYDHATTVTERGAVMLDDEMVDEAMRKMAIRVALKGRAAGLGPPGVLHPAFVLAPSRSLALPGPAPARCVIPAPARPRTSGCRPARWSAGTR